MVPKGWKRKEVYGVILFEKENIQIGVFSPTPSAIGRWFMEISVGGESVETRQFNTKKQTLTAAHVMMRDINEEQKWEQ